MTPWNSCRFEEISSRAIPDISCMLPVPILSFEKFRRNSATKVKFRFHRVIFDGFVAVIEGSAVTFCPSGAGGEFFWLNWSPWCFYRIPSGFLLRPDKIKSNGVTAFDFRFFSFFSWKIIVFVSWVPQKPPESDIWGFWGTNDTNTMIFREKKWKNQKSKTVTALDFILSSCRRKPEGIR